MITTKSKLRAWGRSIGLVLPKQDIKNENLKEGDEVTVMVVKKSNALKETFGSMKFNKTTEQMLQEVDEEGWDE